MKCYAIENHPNDSRVTIDQDGIVQCLSSRMGTGGNNTPFVLITSMKADLQNGNYMTPQASDNRAVHAETEAKELSCFAIDSHPVDSRIEIAGDITPTLTVKIAKGCSDGPLMLVRRNDL